MVVAVINHCCSPVWCWRGPETEGGSAVQHLKEVVSARQLSVIVAVRCWTVRVYSIKAEFCLYYCFAFLYFAPEMSFIHLSFYLSIFY